MGRTMAKGRAAGVRLTGAGTFVVFCGLLGLASGVEAAPAAPDLLRKALDGPLLDDPKGSVRDPVVHYEGRSILRHTLRRMGRFDMPDFRPVDPYATDRAYWRSLSYRPELQ